MKNKDNNALANRLQGFDADELQREMTDGLEQWCRRRADIASVARRAVASLVVLLTLSAVAMTTMPSLRHAVFAPKAEAPVEQPSPTPSTPKTAPLSADTVATVPDTLPAPVVVSEAPEKPPVEPRRWYDFVSLTDAGDTLFCTIVRVAHTVSVSNHGADTHPAGVVVLPDEVVHEGLRYSVIGLGDSAFYGCREMTAIVLPATLTTIGQDAFCGCSMLDSIVCLSAKPPRIKGEWCFWEVPAEAVLSVPCRSATAYRSAHCWDYFDSVADPCAPIVSDDYMQPTVRVTGTFIIVEGIYNEIVRLFDIEGRLIEAQVCNGTCRFNVHTGYGSRVLGTYLLQVGDRPPFKVNVVR